MTFKILKINALSAGVLMTLAAAVLLWYGHATIKRISQLESDWRNSSRLASASAYQLNRLSSHFNAGRFVHHFDDYVAQRSNTSLSAMQKQLYDAYDAMAQLRALPISSEEQQALARLTQQLDIYSAKIEQAQSLFANGATSAQVGNSVALQAEPALQAIELLANINVTRSRENDEYSAWFLQQTFAYIYKIMGFIIVVALAAVFIGVYVKKVIAAGHGMHESNRYLSNLLSAVPDAMLSVDADGRIIKTNAQATSLFGYSQQQLLSMTLEELIPERFRHAHKYLRDGYFRDPRVRRMGEGSNLMALAKDGREIPVEISLSFMQQQRTQFAIATIRDISERIRADEKMRQAATVFENTDEGIVIADCNCEVVTINKAFTNITGYGREDVQGKHILEHYQNRKNAKITENICADLDKSGRWRGELWGARNNGEFYPAWLTISVVKDANGKIINYIAVFSDISAIKQTEEWLTHLAHHDALTQLPNRNLFVENLRESIEFAKRHQQRFALLFLDLDRFKIINDTLGHASGDKLLKVIAARLKKCVRGEDTVARLGGDEFTVILQEVNHSEDVAKVANKIIAKLSQPISIDGREVVTSSSVGISIYPDDAADPDDLAKAADAAMYRAKEQGRNNYQFYSADLTQLAFERLSLEQGLRQALKKEEFVLYYQPQLSIHSGEVVGVEALIRWQHPEMGLVPPDKFIPVAEETGLIQPIGEWVIRSACAQARQWRQQGVKPLRIAVNISARQMLDEASLQRLEQVLDSLNLTDDGLVIDLEITESDLRMAEQSVDTLNRLKAKGVGLAIDDFGTGYSSLSRLKQLPIDTLKIDRSFVKDIPNDPDDEAIAAAVISMGKSLKLNVIGEGVETEEQLSFLKNQGCNEMQGYLYSAPVPANGIVELLTQPRLKNSVA